MVQTKEKPTAGKPDLELLGAFFDPSDVEWRAQRTGYNANKKKPWILVMPYITNRGVMARLDDACTPAGWRNEYKEAPGGGILCGISIKVDDEWITKWDGAENTALEAVKGGLSGSMKRAAVQWGIGRYLYMLEAQYSDVKQSGQHYAQHWDGQGRDKKKIWSGYWDDPNLPSWALPDSKEKAPQKFKWTDPQGYEFIDPVEVEKQRVEAEALAKAKKPLGEGHPANAPVDTEADKPQKDPNVVRFAELIKKKLEPGTTALFCQAVIQMDKPKTIRQIQVLNSVLENRADYVPPAPAPASTDVVPADIDENADISDALDAAIEGLDGEPKQ